MKNIVLFDLKETWSNLLPLTYTRPISSLKIGILTIAQKWEHKLEANYSISTIDYLSEKFSLIQDDDNIIINSQILPNNNLVTIINEMTKDSILWKDDLFVAARIDHKSLIQIQKDGDVNSLKELISENITAEFNLIQRPHDIFTLNGQEITNDFYIITEGKSSNYLNKTNTTIGDHPIFIEDGTDINCSIFNTTDGPIYIGKNATILEGSIIRGPFSMGNSSIIKMGAKIYKNTSIGAHCKIGGEINNIVMLDYSNKGHEGYLGNAVIGEWCNFGADTNNSNLKNNYSEVKLWSYQKRGFEKTGLLFCGLIMGDHSKCGINTMFNTGTVVGVSANIFGAGYQKNFIPSFSWGEPKKLVTYQLRKVIEVAKAVMSRRGLELTDLDIQILQTIFEMSNCYRK